MGQRGPAKTPAAIKIARGTHRADRDGDPALQPQAAPAQLGDPPSHLGEHGRRAWLEVGPILVTAGTLTELDIGPFLRYCEAHDELADDRETLEREGKDFTTDKGFVCQHPAVNRCYKTRAEMARFEARMGMTASDRCGIQLPAKGGKRGVATRKRA